MYHPIYYSIFSIAYCLLFHHLTLIFVWPLGLLAKLLVIVRSSALVRGLGTEIMEWLWVVWVMLYPLVNIEKTYGKWG